MHRVTINGRIRGTFSNRADARIFQDALADDRHKTAKELGTKRNQDHVCLEQRNAEGIWISTTELYYDPTHDFDGLTHCGCWKTSQVPTRQPSGN